LLPERELIDNIRRMAGRRTGRALIRGIGDDSAILKIAAGQQLLVTTDLCVEGVHFRREWHPPAAVGHRCLVRGLSDIAAMGGEPLACFLSLGLPSRLPPRWVKGFLQGLTSLARRFAVPLAGGDISAAPVITCDIVVTGQVRSGKAVLRSGARPGDQIYVTGDLGGSAAVLKRLYGGERVRASRSDRHFYPQPRLEVGRWLRQNRLATAMIDLSDGLSVDLSHICRESGVAARIFAGDVPVPEGASLELALHGGDDYELLFTTPAKARIPARISGVALTLIGTIHAKKNYPAAIEIVGQNGKVGPLKPRGWQHFAPKK
jgi:thiamine-monophosphate kinase